jgi:hypothetical protein
VLGRLAKYKWREDRGIVFVALLSWASLLIKYFGAWTQELAGDFFELVNFLCVVHFGSTCA